jgi:hypothetical protein
MSFVLRRAVLIHTRPAIRPAVPRCTRFINPAPVTTHAFSTSRTNNAAHQAEESYEAFNERYFIPRTTLSCSLKSIGDINGRYEKFFHGANDKFEVQRGLNNVFAYDLVPSVRVCEAALRACRRGRPPFFCVLAMPSLVSFIDINGSRGL